MRVSDAALELLDTVLAQSGSLGECLLGQPGSEPVLSKQVAERHGCGHRRAFSSYWDSLESFCTVPLAANGGEDLSTPDYPPDSNQAPKKAGRGCRWPSEPLETGARGRQAFGQQSRVVGTRLDLLASDFH